MERYSGVKSAERMFDIVELLNRCRGANVAELANKSGFSRRAVDRMLASLIKYGYDITKEEMPDIIEYLEKNE